MFLVTFHVTTSLKQKQKQQPTNYLHLYDLQPGTQQHYVIPALGPHPHIANSSEACKDKPEAVLRGPLKLAEC